MWRALLCLGLGCGRISYDALPGDASSHPSDARLDDAGDDAIAPVACGATLHFADPFDDGVAAPAFVASSESGMTVGEAGGRLTVQFAPVVNGPAYAQYITTTAYAAPGLCATVEVAAVPTNGGAIYAKLRTAQLEVEFFGYNDVLELRTQQSNTVVVRATLPLDLGVHRFWRLRQQGTTTFWETSPDGAQFGVRAMLDGFFTVNTCQLELGGGAIATVTAGGVAAFDSATLRGP